MKIKSDIFRIRTFPRDDKGDKIEPEAQPMQRVLSTDAPFTPQRGGPTAGSIPTEIIYEGSVGDFAEAIRRPCFSCKNFNREAWARIYARWNDPTAPIEMRQKLNGIRAALLESQNATIADRHTSAEGDLDVEHALSTLGVCHPLSEINGAAVITYPTGGCPAEVCGPTQPHGFYKPKDVESERLGSATFDNLMRAAVSK